MKCRHIMRHLMSVLLIPALIFSILSADILWRAETVYAEESYDTETESDAIVENDASDSGTDSSDDSSDDAAEDASDAGSEEETDAQPGETEPSNDTTADTSDKSSNETNTNASDSGSTKKATDSKKDIAGASVTLSYTKKAYTGSALKPSVVVKYAGKKLTSGTDYSVKYKSNKSIGTAYVIVTGKGKYTGSVKKKFTIIPAQVTISSASWSDTSMLTVKWSKVSGSVTKYQIRYRYKRYRKLKPIYKEANWELTFANDIFVRGAGCCVSLASAFAYLARECGYTDVYIGHDTSHAWTVINGYIYDPLFAEAKGMSGNYHSKSKSDYRMYTPYKREI